MPHTAFFRVVTDNTVLDFPSDGTSRTLEFKATGDIVLDTSSARPVLCFQMDPSANSGTPKSKLEVLIRDKFGADRKICTYNLSGSTMRSTMEPINPDWIRGGDNEVNKLIFKADVDAGKLEVRNVVVWFMRDT